MEKFIIFLRHGIAEPRGTVPEETRPLTREGHRRMKEIGRGLAAIFPKAEAIITSPLSRAEQTAEWVSKGYGRKVQTVSSEALRPETSVEAIRNLIDAVSLERFILVGHEPTLTSGMLFLTKMTGSLELKKGGCYGVRLGEDGTASLEWILPPKLLRR
jgi:phosphohistidine phosphatase